MKPKGLNNLRFILLVGFIIRIFFAFNYDTGDSGAVCNASNLFLQSREVYAEKDVYFSPPPFALHIASVNNYIGRIVGLPCEGMWKLPAVLSDIGIGYMVYLICYKHFRKSKEVSLRWVKWYIFNPIAIFVSGFHGQQESFWIFFILLSWYLITYKKNIFLASFSASIALAYKLPAVLLLPGLLYIIKRLDNKILFIAIIALFFIISLFPEIFTSTQALIRQVFLYSSTPGVWGISGIISKFPFLTQYSATVTAVLKIVMFALFINVVLKKEKSFFRTSVLLISIFLVFTPGFGTQYLLWPLPFLILSSNPLLFHYTILVTLGFLHVYGLSFPPLSMIIGFLEKNVYYKINILYPYDLFFPVWLLLIFFWLSKEREFLLLLSLLNDKFKKYSSQVRRYINS